MQIAQGAFGGSRSGVLQAETARNFDDRKADMDARLRSEAFNSAANLFGQDANRQLTADTTNASLGLQGAQLGLQGAGLMGQLGQGLGNEARANAGLLNMFGAQDQATQQRGLDAAYQEFLRGQEDPYRRAQIEMGLGAMTPVAFNSSGTQTQSSSPGLAGVLGLGLQGLSLFGGGG